MFVLTERFFDFVRTHRTVLIASAGILLLITALYGVFGRTGRPEAALPDQIAMVVETESWAVVNRGILESSEVYSPWNTWKADVFSHLWSDAGLLTSAFRSEPDLMKDIAGGRMLAGFSLLPSDSMHAVYIVQLKKKWRLSRLFGHDANHGQHASFHGQDLYTVENSAGGRMVLAQKGNLLIASRFSYLVEDALAQYNSGGSWWNKRHLLRMQDRGKPLQWYFRTDKLVDHLQPVWQSAWRSLFNGLSGSVTGLNIQWDSAGVEGVLNTGMGIPAGRKTAPDPLYSILPDNLALLAWVPAPGRNLLEIMSAGNKKTADFSRYILPWMGKDAAWVLTEPLSTDPGGDACWAIRLRDSISANKLLDAYGASSGMLKKYDYQTFTIRQFLRNSLLAPLLGPGSKFRSPACALIGDYAVFAASPSMIETWVDKYLVNQTLVGRADFQLLRGRMPAESRGVLLLNATYTEAIAGALLESYLFDERAGDLQRLAGAGWLALDMKPSDGSFWRFKVYAEPAGQGNFAASLVWKTSLQRELAGAPMLVKHPDGRDFLFAQDDRNLLFCLDIAGNILWRRQLDGRLLSEVHGMDFYKNKQLSFIFNTSNHVWVIDEKGNNIPGYPLRLQSPSLNGLCLAEFDGGNNYNFFISCANGHLYGYDKHGRPLPGWNPREGVGQSVFPFVHLQAGGKDYLAVLNRTGKLYVFARNGTLRFNPLQLEGKFEGGPQGESGAGDVRIACANTLGKVFIINGSGSVFTLQGPYGDHKRSVKFVFQNNIPGKRGAFIWLAGTKLQAMGYKDNKLTGLYKRNFEAVQDTIFQVQGGLLGVLERKRKRIYLVDPNGQLFSGFPLAGTTPFVAEMLETGQKVLITGNGESVYAYKF